MSDSPAREEAPQTLFHYTSGRALTEIVRTRQLWASDLRFLNDGQEFRFGVNLFAEVLRTEFADRDIPGLLNVLDNDHIWTGTYVASFSKCGDDLSQWRAYSRPGAGFALGVRSKALAGLSSSRVALVRCLYDREEQLAQVRSAITEALQFDPPSTVTVADALSGEPLKLGPVIRAVLATAPRLKDPAFRAEYEWRLVVGPAMPNTQHPKRFRTGRSFLIPFVDIELADAEAPSPFSALIVGPTPEPQLAMRSARWLMQEYAPGSSVTPSAVPYRDW